MRGVEGYSGQFTLAAPNTCRITKLDMDRWAHQRLLQDLDVTTTEMRRQMLAAIKEVDLAIFAAQANSRSPDVPKD